MAPFSPTPPSCFAPCHDHPRPLRMIVFSVAWGALARAWLAIAAALVLVAAPSRADERPVTKDLSTSDWSSIRAAYEAGRHAAVADDVVPGHFHARNAGQQWLTRFDGRGFLTTPNAGGWQWGLELTAYGRAGAMRTISNTACVQTRGTRIEYEWSGDLTEWYINDPRGFEHGYTLRTRPAGARDGCGEPGPLHFTLAVRGDLRPCVSENRRDVVFTTTGGTTALNYAGLKVFDADGVHVAASFEVMSNEDGTPALRLTIDDTHARYPLTIDPIAQQAYLKASNTGAGDEFGHCVAVSGDTVVVGAYLENSSATGVDGNQADNNKPDSGAAYVFVRTGTTWTQQAYLKASNTGTSDVFGYSVAISGDTVVVGAESEDSNATGINGNQADNSASSAGAAYVFVRTGTTWTQQAYLKASNTGTNDFFGVSVAISGDTVVVGAPGEASSATGVNGNQVNNSFINAGAAYVFVRSGITWSQQAYLKASNADVSDSFGSSVAISGDTVVAGAHNEGSSATGVNGDEADNSAVQSGAAYVFVRSGTTWTHQTYLKASNTDASDRFGISVAISGATVVAGARYEDSSTTGVNGNQADNSASDSGAAYVFVSSAGIWAQQAYLKASNTGTGDFFGYSVAISGDTVVVGARGEDSSATGVNGNQADNSASASGAAYAFVRPTSGTTWSQQAYLKASNTGATDLFGISVANSGDTILVGATGEDSNATGVNGNQADNSAGTSGAAYLFTVPVTPSCPLDYNLDTVLNPDDLGDFITDHFSDPAIPGPGGFAIACPENDPPFDAGYKAAYTSDLSGQCNEPFPDNLGDFITDYFASPGC
ncbi:MAG: FG-GAP repeat protein [Phycisphaerales bacterium]